MAYDKADSSMYTVTPTVLSQRLLMAMGMRNGWEIATGDVATAFLHAQLPASAIVYVKVPDTETQWPGRYLKLARSHCGLRTSPKNVQDHMAAMLSRTGWRG